MKLLVCVACAVCTWPVASEATNAIINNGLAPPNAANVIDDAAYSSAEILFIRNEGCSAMDQSPCSSPGASTSVSLVDPGIVAGNLEPNDTSSIVILGGVVGGDVNAYGSSTVLMSGGSVAIFLQASDASIITLSGGTVGSSINAFGSSVIEIVGSGFAIDGLPVDFGELTAVAGILTGGLASGDILENPFKRATAATIRLVPVPEPSTGLLLGLSLMGLERLGGRERRRRADHAARGALVRTQSVIQLAGMHSGVSTSQSKAFDTRSGSARARSAT